MQIIVKQKALYICGNCKCAMYNLLSPQKEVTNGIVTMKCINPECKNKGKVVKIHPLLLEVEPES